MDFLVVLGDLALEGFGRLGVEFGKGDLEEGLDSFLLPSQNSSQVCKNLFLVILVYTVRDILREQLFGVPTS